jgi:ABC-type amino acid transport substrate-binding protein
MRGPAVAAIRRAGALRVAADLSDPPMAFRAGQTPQGFEIDLGTLLARALGVRLEVTDTPLAAMRAGVPRGADVVLSAVRAGQIPGISSTPYYVSGQAILWRDRSPVRSLDALRGRHVAVAAGTPTPADLRGAVLSVSYLPEQALAAVADGRVEAALGDRPLLLWYAHVHPGLGVTPEPGQDVPLVAVVRPDAPDLAAFVSAVIRELRQDGGLVQLRRRWHL